MTLTPRETEICSLIVRGYTAKQIAISLGISHRTVEDHKANIFKDYGVRSMIELLHAIMRDNKDRPCPVCGKL